MIKEAGMAQTQQTDKGVTSDVQGRNEASSSKSLDPKKNTSSQANEEEAVLVNEVEQDPIAMLRSDHRKVEELFSSFEKATSPQEKAQLTKQICTDLMIHTLLEEEIFYPACKGHMEERLLDEAQVEHDGAKTLIVELQSGSPGDPYYDAKVKVLSEDIKHHVAEEEKPTSGIFAKAKQANVSTADLAKQMGDRKRELTEKATAEDLGSPETRSFRIRTNVGTKRSLKEDTMARNSTSALERDDRGRFVADDDHDYRRGSSRSSRHDDDDDRRTSRPRNEDFDDRRYDRPRDEEGRFTSSRSRSRDDDDDRRYSRSSSRDDDDRRYSQSRDDDHDDRRYSRSRDEQGRYTSSRSRSRDDDDDDRRDHGGWFGDRAGHAEAARRGWEEREGSTRSRYRDDDDRRTSRSRDDDYDDRRYDRPRDEEGRFTSSRSRSHEDDDRRGHGGWFGDRAGHAEAARRGWEEREGSTRSRYRDDDRRTSRSRDDDYDDADRRGSRGHGGWFGDPEGHAEAARRGRR
jgi:hemerythrin superfamily protein